MCPNCTDKPCKVNEQPNGKLVCVCGMHSWPNSAVYAEACRIANLTLVKTVHNWTQSF